MREAAPESPVDHVQLGHCLGALPVVLFVYVIGEVERPSSYTVSSLATALTALYRAGGPTR